MSTDGGSAPAALPNGATVGEWRVVRHIAAGGFGAVYEVAHTAHGTRGALKALHGHLLASPEMVARLVREAHVIAQLHHPNVVELLAADTDAGGQPYLVMEYLDGEDLAQAIAARGRLAPLDALAILESLCAAVAAAHECGVVHRDIKASNVFLCGDPVTRVVLLDFGIAKLLDGAGADLTASREALGTPSSMAPEQIRGEPVDGRADIYALGALAYHLLTGRMAFEDASVTLSQYMHLHAARPRPSAIAPLDPGVDDVIARAMSIERARRYPDALAFFTALRGAIAARTAAVIEERVGFAVLVRATAAAGAGDDDAVLDDLDRIIPLAEPRLRAGELVFARDLGDAMLYHLARADAGETQALAAATAAWDAIRDRTDPDPRVRVAVWLHRGPGRLADGALAGGPLADPASWGLPEDEDGLWISGLAACDGRPRRRLA